MIYVQKRGVTIFRGVFIPSLLLYFSPIIISICPHGSHINILFPFYYYSITVPLLFLFYSLIFYSITVPLLSNFYSTLIWLHYYSISTLFSSISYLFYSISVPLLSNFYYILIWYNNIQSIPFYSVLSLFYPVTVPLKLRQLSSIFEPN